MAPARLMKRYRNGYRTGKLINAFGILCQAVGILLGIVLFIGGMSLAQNIQPDQPAVQWLANNAGINASDLRGILIGIGTLLAVVLSLVLWLAGMVISAIGQVLKAVLDTAVFTSPLLSDDEKLRAIS